MSTMPLKSHILPRSYLVGFTSSGTKDGSLWVFEHGELAPRRQTPGETGWLPDFYRVDVPGAEPVEMEKALGAVENRAVRELRQLANPTPGQPLTQEGFGHLITFVALLWARTPRARTAMAAGRRKSVTEAIASNLVSPEQYARLLEAARRAGVVMPTADYDRMKALAAKDQIDLGFAWPVLSDRSLHLAYLEDTMWEAFDLLVRRRWTLFVAGESHFVCGDHPVVLLPTDGLLGLNGDPQAFDDPTTLVVVPLSRHLAWLGTYDGEHAVRWADGEWVADFNAVMVSNAERYVFSSEPDFPVMTPDGSITPMRRLMEKAGGM